MPIWHLRPRLLLMGLLSEVVVVVVMALVQWLGEWRLHRLRAARRVRLSMRRVMPCGNARVWGQWGPRQELRTAL